MKPDLSRRVADALAALPPTYATARRRMAAVTDERLGLARTFDDLPLSLRKLVIEGERRRDASTITAAAFHLPGKHDQRRHGAKSIKSPAEGKQFLDEHYGGWRDELTTNEDKALRFYQSPGFALMNGQLRGLKPSEIKADVSFNDADLKRAKKSSADLKKAINKAPPLDEAMVVHRGFSADQFDNLVPGTPISDKGFTSTSLTDDAGAVGRATSAATATILLPPGTKAAAGSQRELILPPGSRFNVVSVTKKGKKTHVEMELIL